MFSQTEPRRAYPVVYFFQRLPPACLCRKRRRVVRGGSPLFAGLAGAPAGISILK
jgi:hypothetical protein